MTATGGIFAKLIFLRAVAQTNFNETNENIRDDFYAKILQLLTV